MGLSTPSSREAPVLSAGHAKVKEVPLPASRWGSEGGVGTQGGGLGN